MEYIGVQEKVILNTS